MTNNPMGEGRGTVIEVRNRDTGDIVATYKSVQEAREQAKDDAERKQLAEYDAKIDREEKEHFAMLDSIDAERDNAYCERYEASHD
jgi:hypothetical protein